MIVKDESQKIDVLFINEGTYPAVRGGVAGWVNQLITGNPDISFGVIFIGSRKEDYKGIVYALPDNLVFLDMNYLFEEEILPEPEEKKGNEKVKLLGTLLEDTKNIPESLFSLEFYTTEVTLSDFLYGKTTWEFFEEFYLKYELDIPFVKVFWTFKNLFLPLWRAASIVEKFLEFNKEVSVIHSPSTGYAGFLSALIKKATGTPFLLTEHGIYVKERKIDISSSDIFGINEKLRKNPFDIDPLKKFWINFFVNLGKFAYENADKITCLYEDARKLQISLGAPPEKTHVIPNGIKLEVFNPVFQVASRKPVVALIGRVVPIKDVKTFIKAIKLLNQKLSVEGWIVGPTDEDPEYYQECLNLVDILNLKDKVKFLGFQKIPEILKEVGISTLTSISEGMPLTVLESFAGGVPFVATDVGACRQLIYGGIDDRDIALGKAGIIVPVASPSETAQAYEELLTDEEFWRKCSLTGRKRVELYYTYERFIENFRKTYEELKKKWQEYPLS
jgi:glycosyltransferase involved in cell wall biosynthesis